MNYARTYRVSLRGYHQLRQSEQVYLWGLTQAIIECFLCTISLPSEPPGTRGCYHSRRPYSIVTEHEVAQYLSQIGGYIWISIDEHDSYRLAMGITANQEVRRGPLKGSCLVGSVVDESRRVMDVKEEIR
jgi:hypothetical protein